jgi:hypothetical protein
MKKLLIAVAMVAMLVSVNANAFWGGNNNGGYNYNDWPVWTPMYWMEEMENEFDDNNWGGNGNGWNNGYGPYNGGGYGMPYGGGYGPYNGGGYRMPYGGGNPAYYPYSNGYPAPAAPIAPAAE